MPLINTISDFNKYVTVSSDFDQAKFLKYTTMAERNIIKIIGQTKYDEIVSDLPTDPTRILLCEYAANMGLSYALPSFVLNITNMGVFTNATTDSQRAEWWQMKDLNRSLLKFAFNALDDALNEIGIENSEIFDGLFITTLAQFEKVFSLGSSSQTFLSLIPFIREVQNMYLLPTLGNCRDYEFSDDQLEIIRAAVANLALSHAATSGGFSLELNAVILRIEVMPWEKIEKLEQNALTQFKEARFNIGMGYLSQLSKILKTLPCYQTREISSEIEKLDSGLYL